MEKTKILVVDDEKDVCNAVSNFLIRRDYEVLTAYTKEEALEKLQRQLPQLIILDIKLEGESGFDILKKAKEIDKNICVIMLTGTKDEENIRIAKKLGADGYIKKPLVNDYLEKALLKKISLMPVRKE